MTVTEQGDATDGEGSSNSHSETLRVLNKCIKRVGCAQHLQPTGLPTAHRVLITEAAPTFHQ